MPLAPLPDDVQPPSHVIESVGDLQGEAEAAPPIESSGVLRDLGRHLWSRLRRHTSDGRYRPEIDGLRFFAIAMVLFGHLAERCLRSLGAAGLPQTDQQFLLTEVGFAAWRGVLLFFSVSGFIIATQFLKRGESPVSGSFLKRYFSRRVLRIEPPYFILLIITYAFVCTFNYTPPVSSSFNGAPSSMTVSFLASLVYAHGLLFGNFPRLFPPGWSLEVEVQFYVLAPLFFWLYFSIRDRMARTFVGAFILFGMLLMAIFVPGRDQAPFIQFSIMRYAQFFWLGILLADWQGPIKDALANRRSLAAALGWIGCISLLIVDNSASDPGNALILGMSTLASIGFMFSGALAIQNSFSKFCSIPFVAIVGGECYSIYLTHLQPMQVMTPLIVRLTHISSPVAAFVVTFIIEMPIILGVSTLFFVLLERPFMIDGWPSKLRVYLTRSISKRRLAATGR